MTRHHSCFRRESLTYEFLPKVLGCNLLADRFRANHIVNTMDKSASRQDKTTPNQTIKELIMTLDLLLATLSKDKAPFLLL